MQLHRKLVFPMEQKSFCWLITTLCLSRTRRADSQSGGVMRLPLVNAQHLVILLGQAAEADDSIRPPFAHLEYNSQIRYSFPRGHKRPVTRVLNRALESFREN
jgi:hypothetical protein